MPMSIYVKKLYGNEVTLLVDKSDTPPPKGVVQPDGSTLLDPRIAAGYLQALSAEAVKAATSAPRGAQVQEDGAEAAGVSRCKSCDAAILWATWESSGRAAPVDALPVADGKLAIVKGKIHYYGPEDARLQRDRYTSHFATCPDVKDHRGGRR